MWVFTVLDSFENTALYQEMKNFTTFPSIIMLGAGIAQCYWFGLLI